jgi:hypothetical protein
MGSVHISKIVSSICKQVEVDITRFVQGQLRHEPVTDKILHYISGHGALLPGQRITQLQIPHNHAVQDILQGMKHVSSGVLAIENGAESWLKMWN